MERDSQKYQWQKQNREQLLLDHRQLFRHEDDHDGMGQPAP